MSRRRNRCPWCDGSGRFIRTSGIRVTMYGTVEPDVVACRHPGPVVIRALPGAEFRTTKFIVAKSKDGTPVKRGRPATGWRPPTDVGRAFAEVSR